MARTIAKDHDNKRQAILKVAANIFAREGYGRASMAAVAEECGISKANIYHYYSGKDALLFDILDTHLKALRDRICQLTFDTEAPSEQLAFIVTELLLAYDGADTEHEVQLNALAALPEEKQETLRRYQRDLVSFVRARVRAMAPQSIRDDKSQIRAVTMSIFAMVNWHYKWDADADANDRQTYARLIARLIEGGLRAQ